MGTDIQKYELNGQTMLLIEVNTQSGLSTSILFDYENWMWVQRIKKIVAK